MRRPTILLAVASLAVSLAVAPVAAARPAKGATASPTSPAKPGSPVKKALVGGGGKLGAHPESLRASAVAAAAGSSSVQAPARVPHLDPQLQTHSSAKESTVAVTVTGANTQILAQLATLGGRVLASVPGHVSALVPVARLTALAGSAGVALVAKPHKAVVDTASEGVAASNAGVWQNAGNSGAGVKVGIVDGGFAGLADEVSAGNLPAGTVVNGDHCADVDSADHGTAVAEVVHQMAPGAQLFLYCIDDNVGFAAAETELADDGVTVVNSSLSFPGDSRGDGTGSVTAAATTVKKARQAGILWIQSAGNAGTDHWGGNFADANHDTFIDLNGPFDDVDYIRVFPGGYASFLLQWDGWPTSRLPIALDFVPLNDFGDQVGPLVSVQQDLGTEPVLAPCFAPFGDGGCMDSNSFSEAGQLFVVFVQLSGAVPHVRYDLSYRGAVSANAYGCQTVDENDNCIYNVRAAAGSIAEPASSPYVLGVGAFDVGAHSPAGFEAYSSQGPTIDGRVKPDITSWDGTSSFLPSFEFGFYGTSAAAPHVAGAAALVSGLHPSWDAAQLQNYLEQQAGNGHPNNPPNNQTGHGVMTLGASASSALPVTSKYTALATPVRILDTRPAQTPPGNKGQLNTGQTRTIAMPAQALVPPDATAVAVNLTGIGARSATFLSAFPGGTTWPKTSNLNLSVTDPTAAVFAIVTLGTAQRIAIRNNFGLVDVAVDVVGYFGTAAETGRYTAIAANRVLDTRTTNGGHHGLLAVNEGVTVLPALPAGASAAIVNVTVADTTGRGGFINAAAACSTTTSTLNFTRFARANLAIVTLDGSGNFCIKNSSSPANVLVDVVGYLSPTTGSSYVALPAPVRIADTRTGNGGAGNGGSPRPLHSQSTDVFWGAGIFAVPYAATALFTGVLDVNATNTGFFTLFPGPTKPAASTSTLNFSKGRVVPNAAIVGLSTKRFGVFNNIGNADAAVDLFGYFI